MQVFLYHFVAFTFLSELIIIIKNLQICISQVCNESNVNWLMVGFNVNGVSVRRRYRGHLPVCFSTSIVNEDIICGHCTLVYLNKHYPSTLRHPARLVKAKYTN